MQFQCTVLTLHLNEGISKRKHRSLNETNQIAGRDSILDALSYDESVLNT